VAGEQIISPSGALVSGRITPSVFPFYTTGEDNLRIVSFNSAASVKIRLVARLLGRDGRPSPSGWDHTPNTDRSAKSNDFTLSGQTLLNVHVTASAGTPLIGQCYVIVQLIRGIGSAAIVVGTILAGPVTATQSLGFPGSPIQAAVEGIGYIREIIGSTPAAGAEILETVPTGARWQVLAFRYTLTTSGTVANRKVNFRVTLANASFVYISANPNLLTAGLVGDYSIAPNVGYQNDATLSIFTIPMPQDTTLIAGAKLGTTTSALQAGDQFSSPRYLVREWLDV
jgi:hypothetical protein